jgi:hypothetical protein
VAFDVTRPSDGEAIAISGFPLYGVEMNTVGVALASAWDTDKRQSEPLRGSVDSYVAGAHINSGDGGSPVYSVRTGAVPGLCDSFTTDLVSMRNPNHGPAIVNGNKLEYNSGLANVVPAKYLVRLLDKNKVKWSGAH